VSAAPGLAQLVTLADVRHAADRLRGIARLTPVLPASTDEAWAHLRLKCESLQVAGAFKLRGAFHFISRLEPATCARGVITYSSGNHGQAVAWAARRLSVPAVVVMPTTAPAVKVDGARALGAEVLFAGLTTIDRKVAAEALQRERGLAMVPPFDDERIIAGQGTVGLELVAQEPGVTAVYVPLGGGGLASGVAAAVKGLKPGVRVVGVEPEGAPKMTRSIAAGHPVTLDRVSTMADGLMAVRPGDLTFAHVRALADEVVTVSEDEIVGALRMLVRESKIVAEPSGAVSVAGALRLAPRGSSGVHVAIVSGGNIAPDALAGLLSDQTQ
jgi:threonine dehydratase